MAGNNRDKIVRALAKAGLEPHAIAGILANLDAESGYSTEAVNPSSGAYGIAQWLGTRKSRLQRLAAKRGKPMSNLGVQIELLITELKEGQSGPTGTATIKTMNAQKNVGAAADFFSRNFERGESWTHAGRQAAAAKYLPAAKRGSKGVSRGPVGKPITWVPKGTVGQPYANPNSNYEAGAHTGVDITADEGSKIIWAPQVSGKVVRVNDAGSDYGNHMIIRDDKGREWLFAHMSSKPLKKGTRVEQGQVIGRVGSTGTSTGAHLHIEQTPKGVKWDYGLGPTKDPRITFTRGSLPRLGDGFEYTDEDYLDLVGLSGEALQRPGNEELEELVQMAVDEDWTSQEFQRRFKRTDWYRERAKSQRDWDMMQDTEQQQIIAQKRAYIRTLETQYGIGLTKEQRSTLALRLARDNYTDEQAAWYMSKRYDPARQDDEAGVIAAAKGRWRALAREYGVQLPKSVMDKWASELIGTKGSPDDYLDEIVGIAGVENPWLREAYERGLTTREALTPYLNIASQVLGVDSDTFNLADPKWREVFTPDGQQVSAQEWRRRVKTDPRYDYRNSQNAVNTANAVGRNMARVMGMYNYG